SRRGEPQPCQEAPPTVRQLSARVPEPVQSRPQSQPGLEPADDRFAPSESYPHIVDLGLQVVVPGRHRRPKEFWLRAFGQRSEPDEVAAPHGCLLTRCLELLVRVLP